MSKTRASMTVGRATHPTAKSVEQLPSWISEVGLEWLYRFFAQFQQEQGALEAGYRSDLGSKSRSSQPFKPFLAKRAHFPKRSDFRLSSK